MSLSLGIWGDLPALTLLLLFAVAVLAGFVDSIAGGGGLLCVPALLWAGLTPAQTLATNKLQGSFGTFSATLSFLRAGQIDLVAMRPAVLAVFAGSAAGTLTVQVLDASFLKGVLPILLIGVALFFILSPRIGENDCRQRLSLAGFACSFAPALGFYDGFFGPGTGSFFAIVLVTALGYNLRKATAHTKLLNLTSNIASVLFFLLGGKLVWAVGLTMALGQFLGAKLGSRLVIAKGAGLVRPCLVVVSLAITAKIVIEDSEGWPHRTLVALWDALV